MTTDQIDDDYVTVEIYVFMNEDGEYTADQDQDAANEDFSDNVSGMVKEQTKINIRMKKPKLIAREVSGDLPDGASEATFVLTQV